MHVNTYLFPRAVQGLACPQSQHDADCLETYALQYSAASPISLKSALKELHMCVALLELMRDDVIWDLQQRASMTLADGTPCTFSVRGRWKSRCW